MRDDDGSLPVHIVSGATRSGSLSNQYTPRVLRLLLDEYPESVSLTDGKGRLALHMAVENKLPFFEALADAEPRALSSRCPVTHMYPFQLAGLPMHTINEYDDADRIKTISASMAFTLLRKSPHLLQRYLSNKSWMESEEYKEIHRNNLRIAQLIHQHNLRIAQLAERNISLKRKVDEMIQEEEG